MDYLSIASEIAREAGEVLRSFSNKQFKVEYKQEFDVVTAADRASEEVVVRRLRERLPHHSIVAEEGGGVDQGSEYVWHVDPLDGTTNFAHRYPLFAVSIGLERNGEGLAGVVYNPITEEFFAAESGSGAYLNNRRIKVSAIGELKNGLFATGFPPANRTKSPNFYYFQQFSVATHGTRRSGSAALDLCAVACGRFEGFWEFGLKSWDVSAGLVILKEAGGQFTSVEGLPYGSGDASLVASNRTLQQPMLELFERVNRGEFVAPIAPPPGPRV